MKTVYIIHGWGGNPEEPLYRWLRKNLEQKGYEVVVPDMPDTDEPHIDAWVSKIKEIVKWNNEVIFVGHSIGCQAILRYLMTLTGNEKAARVVFLAPWTHLHMEVIEEEGEESIAVANEWLEAPLDFTKAREHIAGNVTAIFSDDDPDVPLSEKDIFAEKLRAKIVVEHNKEHFTEEGGVTELPSALEAIVTVK